MSHQPGHNSANQFARTVRGHQQPVRPIQAPGRHVNPEMPCAMPKSPMSDPSSKFKCQKTSKSKRGTPWLLAEDWRKTAQGGVAGYSHFCAFATPLYTGEISRSRDTAPEISAHANSASSAIFCLPRLTRILAFARSRLSPIAVKTCEASIAPDEHAAPVETASPFKSSAMTSASPSMPSK